jgi:hypothetical protein
LQRTLNGHGSSHGIITKATEDGDPGSLRHFVLPTDATIANPVTPSDGEHGYLENLINWYAPSIFVNVTCETSNPYSGGNVYPDNNINEHLDERSLAGTFLFNMVSGGPAYLGTYWASAGSNYLAANFYGLMENNYETPQPIGCHALDRVWSYEPGGRRTSYNWQFWGCPEMPIWTCDPPKRFLVNFDGDDPDFNWGINVTDIIGSEVSGAWCVLSSPTGVIEVVETGLNGDAFFGMFEWPPPHDDIDGGDFYRLTIWKQNYIPFTVWGHVVDYDIDPEDPCYIEPSWSGDMMLMRDVTIDSNATLSIAPGSHVYLCKESEGDTTGISNNIEFTVYGTMKCVGFENAPITFSVIGDTFNEPVSPGDWYGIRVKSGGKLNIDYAQIEHAYHAVDISSGSDTVSISNTKIELAENAGIR